MTSAMSAYLRIFPGGIACAIRQHSRWVPGGYSPAMRIHASFMVKFCLAKAVECRRAAELATDPARRRSRLNTEGQWFFLARSYDNERRSSGESLTSGGTVADTRRVDWRVGRPSLSRIGSRSPGRLMTKPQDEYFEQIERLEAENERLRAAIEEAQEAIKQLRADGPRSIDLGGILARLRAALRRHNDPS